MKMEEYPNVFVMDHPLIQHKLTFLRMFPLARKISVNWSVRLPC